MACMNSMTSTVLPTPAPPKRPVLPPRTNGHSRSITLMPVGRISPTPIASSSGPGAATIGRVPLAASGAPPSSGLPNRSSNRPRQSGVTGTASGPPLSKTGR